jgi:hypothetical protein
VDMGKRCRSGNRVISCVSYHLDVSVIPENGALKLAYDFEKWRTACYCAERPGPADCSSFAALREIIREMPRHLRNER